MNSVFPNSVDPSAFLREAIPNGFSMREKFIHPIVGRKVSDELEHEGFLVDYTELQYSAEFEIRGMRIAAMLHEQLNDVVTEIMGFEANHLPLFSVRVFEPGETGTTIHRNDPCIGPWAIGTTLRGEAPFNAYRHSQLPDGYTRSLRGDEHDPKPLATMNAKAGSGWALFTKYELMPHSSGVVTSDIQRELLIFYAEQ